MPFFRTLEAPPGQRNFCTAHVATTMQNTWLSSWHTQRWCGEESLPQNMQYLHVFTITKYSEPFSSPGLITIRCYQLSMWWWCRACVQRVRSRSVLFSVSDRPQRHVLEVEPLGWCAVALRFGWCTWFTVSGFHGTAKASCLQQDIDSNRSGYLGQNKQPIRLPANADVIALDM